MWNGSRVQQQPCRRSAFINFLEFQVAKLSSVLFSLFTFFMMVFAYAADIKDDPIPDEPNWLGIIVFLVLMFGGGGWYMWKVMSAKSKDENKK
jgi:hypothetical protein